jgi:riboflavin kinase/FMN adenylyltransferase
VTEEVKYEVYYFDFSGDLYDKNIEIEFLEFIRPELKFDGLQLLIEQIKHDEKIARRWLELHSEEL